MPVHFADELKETVDAKDSRLVVGIDPDPDLLPPEVEGTTPIERVDEFGRRILESIATEAAAVKFQSAFYERFGPPGAETLAAHLETARGLGLITILDAKRNDIGNTAGAYAAAYLGQDTPTPFDALTVSPYLGADSLEPFVKAAADTGRGVFVLVKTSNPGSGDFQDVETVGGGPLYLRVAETVAKLGKSGVGECGYSSVGAVCGATYPELLTGLREAMPEQVFLVPGVGAQGGSPDELAPAFDQDGFGALVAAARSVIYGYREHGGDYAVAAREAAATLRIRINEATAAGHK
ncbi:MAG: orotidine-5'-phosphate decarboxylase [Candidatus Coatesbacteria bacterium]|nr:MAG: orotidine-5'-phosphate decarboxylase [Candidatus Coatesbacteria bacterium]